MKTLADALAKIDRVEREISGIGSKELRDAVRGYADAQRELIKALGEFDRPQLAGPPGKGRNLSSCGSPCQPRGFSMPRHTSARSVSGLAEP
jgi:hypothetical protein